jgi:D-psicose/D-tagatose/L-ribulose 3-epimerase
MRFGICAAHEAAALAEAGYDYLEWSVRGTVGAFDVGEYADLRRLVARLPIRPEAWNQLLPAELKVVGPEANHAALQDYVALAFPRIAELGGEVVVFGSGDSRRVPDGYPPNRALAQFEEACRIAGDAAQRHGLIVAIEPLNRRETNLVNSVAETAEIARRVAHPAVRVLSDLYHVMVEGESFADTASAGPILAHVHVAAPDRQIPRPGHGEQELRDYFLALQSAGYDGRVSIEARWSGIEDATTSVHLMREIWASVQHDRVDVPAPTPFSAL